MTTHAVSAVLFAKDLQKVATFYREVCSAQVVHSDPEHEVLSLVGFHLVVHRIPLSLSQSMTVAAPPERRERAAIRLDFPVDDIAKSRVSAQRLGGRIDDGPPPWAEGHEGFLLGYDPEGNVIGVMLANKSPENTRGE